MGNLPHPEERSQASPRFSQHGYDCDCDSDYYCVSFVSCGAKTRSDKLDGTCDSGLWGIPGVSLGHIVLIVFYDENIGRF